MPFACGGSDDSGKGRAHHIVDTNFVQTNIYIGDVLAIGTKCRFKGNLLINQLYRIA